MGRNAYWSKLKESGAKKIFIETSWGKKVPFCLHCKSEVYRIRRSRYRCIYCNYEFGDFTGRWISKVKIPCIVWIRVIRSFLFDESPMKVSAQIGLSYPTIVKAFHVIRLAIAAASEDRDVFFGKIDKKPDDKSNSLVFGIFEDEVEIVEGLSPETILSLPIKRMKYGSIIYTERFQKYDSLIFYGPYIDKDHVDSIVKLEKPKDSDSLLKYSQKNFLGFEASQSKTSHFT